MKLCFLIDDKMHWALIDVLLWYSFCRHDYSFFCGCFLVACYYCFQSYMQFCASRKRLALTESLFFGDLKTWIFLTLLSLFRVLIGCDCDETVLLELVITSTGLRLTCFVTKFVRITLVFSCCFRVFAFIAFKKSMKFCASRKTSTGLWLSHCFWKLNSESFASFSLLKLILIVMKLCFLIDNKMHWALIDVLLWYSFCRHDYLFFCGCFLAACYYCFQSYMQFCASRKRLALTESLFFGVLKTWIFLTLLSLFRVLIGCDCDETVLLEVVITSTGLRLTCFVTKFVRIT